MIQSQPIINFVYNRRHTASSTKKASVEMRITYNYKQKFISTGIQLYPNQWKNGQITNCPDILQISEILNRLLSDVRNILNDMLLQGYIDLALIPQKLKTMREGKVTFLEYCKQRTEVRKYGKSPDSQERYDRFLRLFRQWGQIVVFKDITETSIIAYDKYLSSTGMKAYSRWNNYHRFLNSFIIDAINDGYLQRNPYKWINIARSKDTNSLNKYLSPEEVYAIKNAKMPTQSLERVRDMFIFQVYTCLSYSDLKTLDPTNIKDYKEMKVYVGKRYKTGKPFFIPLLPPALVILQKYNNRLPVISNTKYNEYIKIVAQAAGIDKPVSTHWARHTGATLLLNEGVDMKIVSRICGHSSTKITESTYAKLLDETVLKAIQEVQDNFK